MKISNKKIQLILANKKMTLKEVCEKANISENAFRSIRQGKSVPRPLTLGKIAEVLNVSVQDIIEDME